MKSKNSELKQLSDEGKEVLKQYKQLLDERLPYIRSQVEQCLLKSQKALTDKKGKLFFVELCNILYDIGIKGGDLEMIYDSFFGEVTEMLAQLEDLDSYRQEREKQFKYSYRDAKAAVGKIAKLKPLNAVNCRENFSANDINEVNEGLNEIQQLLPLVVDAYFSGIETETFSAKKTKELEKDIDDFLSKKRVVNVVNELKRIGYSETRAVKIVSKLFYYSPLSLTITEGAILKRYKRNR